MLEASMLSFTSGCLPLPVYIKEKKKFNSNTTLVDGTHDKCMKILKSYMKSQTKSNVLSPITSPVITPSPFVNITPYTQSVSFPDDTQYQRFVDTYNQDGDVVFRLGSYQPGGSLILLTRHQPSLCPICNVIHDAISPYMFVAGTKLYFNCRRSKHYLGKNTNLLIGELSPEDVKITNSNPTVMDWMNKKASSIDTQKSAIDMMVKMMEESKTNQHSPVSSPSSTPISPLSTPSSTPISPLFIPSINNISPLSIPVVPMSSFTFPASTVSSPPPRFNVDDQLNVYPPGTPTISVPNVLNCHPPSYDVQKIMDEMSRTPMSKRGKKGIYKCNKKTLDKTPEVWSSGPPDRKKATFM